MQLTRRKISLRVAVLAIAASITMGTQAATIIKCPTLKAGTYTHWQPITANNQTWHLVHLKGGKPQTLRLKNDLTWPPQTDREYKYLIRDFGIVCQYAKGDRMIFLDFTTDKKYKCVQPSSDDHPRNCRTNAFQLEQ